MQAQLVTFEGIEGSGKSVQLRRLAEAMRQIGIPVVASCEPGGTPFGHEVRRILLDRDGAPREPVSELLLYLADRYQHARQVIDPALAQGSHVLCDRYHDATRVYQGCARGVPESLIDGMASLLEIRRPDLTLVFDLPVAEGLARARRRAAAAGSDEGWTRFEAESLAFHERVREGYRQLARREPDRCVVIDASGPELEVAAQVKVVAASRGLLATGA